MRALYGIVSFLAGLLILGVLLLGRDLFIDPALLAWVVALALVELFPVPTWNGSNYSVSDPLAIALMIIFPPPVVLVATFVESCDPRELTRKVGFLQAVFNRSQGAIAYGLGSVVFHSLSDVSEPWQFLVPAALLSASTSSFVNLLFVALATSLERRMGVMRAARALLMDSPKDWFLGYLCFGLMGVAIARLYAETGSIWVIGLSAIPLMVLGRGALLHVRLAQKQVRNAQEREARVRSAADRAVAERRDERMQLAAALHDEAIPMFQGVNLLATTASVCIGDPSQLRSLLTDIREASDSGSEQLRRIVGELRRSELGDDGLAAAIRRLVREERRRCPTVQLDLHLEEVSPPRRAGLLLYQIAREGLVNALNHSGASRVVVSLASSETEGWVLQVSDNGRGFDLDAVASDHFGLMLMRERAERLAGRFAVTSGPDGSTVSVAVPVRARWESEEQ